MKLLVCRNCGDVFRLKRTWRQCDCGKARGRYLADGAHAEVGADSSVIGIDHSLDKA